MHGKEVASILCVPAFERAAREGIDEARLAEGTGLSADELKAPGGFIPWRAFAQVCGNAQALWGDDGLRELGLRLLSTIGNRPLRTFGRYLYEPAEFYRWLAMDGRHKAISCLDQRLIEHERNRLTIEVQMQAGYTPCREYFVARAAFLAAIPNVVGHDDASVELDVLVDGARFEIRIPEGCGTLASARRLASRLLPSLARRDELQVSFEHLAEQHRASQQRIAALLDREKQVAEREALFRQAFESAPIAMVISVAGGAILDVNRKFCERTGYRREECIGQRGHHLGLWRFQERNRVRALRRSSEEGLDGIEATVHTRDGEELNILLSVKSVALGGQKCVLWQAQDLTERKRAEEELEVHRNHLEALVETRSQELERSRERLVQSERLASIGTLAAGIAHQINNPVGSIRTAAEFALISADEPDKEAIWREALEECVRQADRCAGIVRSILLFSSGQSAPKEILDLSDVASRSRDLTLRFGAEHGARIDFTGAGEPAPVAANAIQLEQVFVNLLRNAVEAGEQKVHISLRVSIEGDVARAEISDDGPGIAAEHLPQLFDPFYTTRLGKGGTGLGLSVAHGLVRAHAGEIGVESELGRGTRIWVDLPLVRAGSDELGES